MHDIRIFVLQQSLMFYHRTMPGNTEVYLAKQKNFQGRPNPDPQKVVNVPRIQNSHLRCSSNIFQKLLYLGR
jgi:hypothetical protein